MKEETIIKEEILFDYLLNKFKKLSRNSVKNLLAKKQIIINGKVVTKYNYLLKAGDKISFNGLKDNMGLKIIYEDDLFLVINKKAGLLTVATDKEKEKTAYVMAMNYVRQFDAKNKVYVLHRLDKDTSGVLAFCKNEKVKNELQQNWNNAVIKREYYALIENKLSNKTGKIESYLIEEKNGMVHSTNKRNGKLAITQYEVIEENQKYSLLKINLLTGRKNQIRVQFSELGNPLVGDKKYGKDNKELNRLGLHASALSINYLNKAYNFNCEMPLEFKKIINK